MKRLIFLGILVFFSHSVMYGMKKQFSLFPLGYSAVKELPCLDKIVDNLVLILNISKENKFFKLTEEEIRQIQKILCKDVADLSSCEKDFLSALLEFPTTLMNKLISILYVDQAALRKCLPNDDQLNSLYSLFENISPVIVDIINHPNYSFSDVVKQCLPSTCFAVTGEECKNYYNFPQIDNMIAQAYYLKHARFINNFYEKTAPFEFTLTEIDKLKKIVETDDSFFPEIKEKCIKRLPDLLIQKIIHGLPEKFDPADEQKKKFLSDSVSKKLYIYYKSLLPVLCATLDSRCQFSFSFKKYLPLTHFAVTGEKYKLRSDLIEIDCMLANKYLEDYSPFIKNFSEKTAPFGLTQKDIELLKFIAKTDVSGFSIFKEKFLEPLPNTLIQKTFEASQTEKAFLSECQFKKLYDYFQTLLPVLCVVLRPEYTFSFSFKECLPQTYCAITQQQYPSHINEKFKDIDLMLKNEYAKKYILPT